MSATNETLLALGEYRFSIATAILNKIQRDFAWRWADINITGGKPQSHFIGQALIELNLSATVYPHYRGGLAQVDKLAEHASLGKPLRLVDGTGKDWGLFTVRKIAESQEQLRIKGRPLKITFSLELTEYRGLQ